MKKTERAVTMLMAIIICFSLLVNPALALTGSDVKSETKTSNEQLINETDTLYNIDYKKNNDLTGKSDAADLSQKTYASFFELNDNETDLATIEKALSDSGMRIKVTNESAKITLDYGGTPPVKGNVILKGIQFGYDKGYSTGFVEHGDLNIPILRFFDVFGVSYSTKWSVKVTDGDDNKNKLDSVDINMFVVDTKSDDGTTSKTRIVVRVSLFDSSSNKVRSGTPVYYQDYDVTSMFSRIATSDKSLDGYPIISYICSKYSNHSNDVRNETQKKQKELWDNYSTLCDFSKSGDLKDAFSYISDNKTDKKVPTGLFSNPTPKETATIMLIASALKNSTIYTSADYDFATLFSGFDTTSDNLDLSTYATDGESKFNNLTQLKDINDVAKKYNDNRPSYSAISDTSNAVLFKDLVMYRYGFMCGVEDRSTVSSNVEADTRLQCEALDKLLYTSASIEDSLINPNLFDQYSSMKKPGGSYTIKSMLDLFASMQHLEYYAQAGGAGGITDKDGKLSNAALEEYLSNMESYTEAEKTTALTTKVAEAIKAYKSIHDGLNYIGIKPWTTELTYIYNLYESIKGIEVEEVLNAYDAESDTEPLRRFFSFDDEKVLSKNILNGIALSSTYIPMQMNLYDPTCIRVLEDEKWLTDFHMRYGFYRKAVMIDENVNAAVDRYVTGSRGTTRPCLLSDLLETEKDIVLYVDDNYYNIKDLAEITDKVYERLANTEQAGMSGESFTGTITDLFNTGIEDIAKTGPTSKYKESYYNGVRQYGNKLSIDTLWDTMKENLFTDGILLGQGIDPADDSKNEIKKGLTQREYSVTQSYAVVSAIYRHKSLASGLNRISLNTPPIFISSPALWNVEGITEDEFSCIYNYMMLRNLKASMGVDYRTTLDLDNPIYVDIYGNIVTESGLVVIPAASNATLYSSGTYTPYNLGFMCLYSNGNNLKISKSWTESSNVNKYLKDFTTDESGKFMLQKNAIINDVYMNPQSPSVASAPLLKVLFDTQVSLMNKGSYNYDQRIWLITEVMRGAPIENIDKEFEGITGKRDISKYGLYISWKLDELANSLLPTTNGNSMISMPNLAFMPGIEYLVLFIYKALMLLFVMYIMYNIYIDAVGSKLGLRTFTRCTSTIVTFILCLCAIPAVISISYNEPNKIFLQDEIKYINLLNYEKRLEGREISAVGTTQPQSQTELYLKIDSLSVPWYKIIPDVMFAPIGTKLSEMYDEEMQENPLYGYDDVQVVNDGVYIDVDDIFSSSSVIYNDQNKYLYQNMNVSPTASFFIPYYYILDSMIDSINVYNNNNGIINITTKIQSDGSVKTMGMIGDYLLSEYFLMEANDPLGLYSLYNIKMDEQSNIISADEDSMNSSKSSMWYASSGYTDEEIASNIDQLYSYMRAYVADNREMIGRVTDETFLKTMMLDISMKYNDIFRVQAARGIEVFSVDSRDLIRLSITDKNESVVNCSNSFGKFVYEEAGGFGVIATSILIGIYFIAFIVKPALVIFLCALLMWNVLVKSMVSMSRGKTVEGLLYILSILVIINSSYALLLKLSMSLPALGLNPIISIIGQIIIQVAYLAGVFILVDAIFKDIGNMGYNIFHSIVLAASGAVAGGLHAIGDRATYTKEERDYMESAKQKNESESRLDSMTLREIMEERDRRREEEEEGTAFYNKKKENEHSTSNK